MLLKVYDIASTHTPYEYYRGVALCARCYSHLSVKPGLSVARRLEVLTVEGRCDYCGSD